MNWTEYKGILNTISNNIKEAQRALTETKLELESYKEMVDSYKNKIKQNKIEIDVK